MSKEIIQKNQRIIGSCGFLLISGIWPNNYKKYYYLGCLPDPAQIPVIVHDSVQGSLTGILRGDSSTSYFS
jgi:hypothetical protein